MTNKKALTGVTILEYADSVAGSYCSKVMADMGADVIKIERPGVGDESRKRGPFSNNSPHPEKSGLFLYLNINKRGITLDPTTPTGKMLFEQLAQKVDILVESNPAGFMEKHGIGYESLKEINPRLIMTSITPFGQTGPHANYKAYPLNTYHSGQLGYLTPMQSTSPEQPPLKGGGYFGEYCAGLMAGVAAQAALFSQRKTGQGQHIDMSKQENLMSLGMIYVGLYSNDNVVTNRFGGGMNMQVAAGGQRACKDGHVAVLTVTPQQWQSLVKLMGNPEWADERTNDQVYRIKHYKEIDAHINEWMMQHTKEEIYHEGQKLGLPVTPMSTAEDVLHSKQLESRGFFGEVSHPEMGTLKMPSAPWTFSKTPWAVERTAPLLGQHNKEVYCKELGVSNEDLVALRRSGVI